MATLTFNAVILYGDDRGSVRPFRTYEVDLPNAKHEAYLNELNAQYQRAMEAVVGEFDYDRSVWVENVHDYLDETDQMLRRDRYPENEENPDLTPASPIKAAQQVLRDTLKSSAFADTFWEEEDLVDLSIAELLKASKRKPEVKPIVTERIALGTLCYHLLTGNPYTVATAAAPFEGPTKYTSERDYVPVSEVEAEKAVIETFPLPHAVDKRNRWFARVKESKKLEAIAIKRADAIFKARILAAHKRFWA